MRGGREGEREGERERGREGPEPNRGTKANYTELPSDEGEEEEEDDDERRADDDEQMTKSAVKTCIILYEIFNCPV